MGRFKQIVTHPQRETAEIIQQWNIEERILPGPHLCILKHFGYVWGSLFWIQSPAHSTALSV